MQAQRSGAIVNISTYATFEPEALFPTSGVFRAGGRLHQGVPDEYAAHNVRMNNVLPGFIDSLPEKEERAPARWPLRHGPGSGRPDRLPGPDASSTSPARTSASTAASPVRSNPVGCPRASARRGAGTAHPLMALIRLAVLKLRRARRYLRFRFRQRRPPCPRRRPWRPPRRRLTIAQRRHRAPRLCATRRYDAQLAMPRRRRRISTGCCNRAGTPRIQGQRHQRAAGRHAVAQVHQRPRPGAHPRRLRAVRDLRCERGVHHRVLAVVRRGRLHGPWPNMRRLQESARRRQPEPVHGLHADLSRQPQGRPAHRPPSRRELRA